MGCVATDSWLWPYLAGIATITMLFWILALAKVTGFSGTSARHTHFAQLSNTSVRSTNELPRDCISLQCYPHGHQSKNGRLHRETTEPLRRPTCVPVAAGKHASRGSCNDVRPGQAARDPSTGRLSGSSREESSDACGPRQNPEPCTK